jgi:hypothetical protein
MTAAPARVSSALTNAILVMFFVRSSREKPSSADNSARTVSPRSKVTERPACWFKLTCRARATASLPELWYPVRKTEVSLEARRIAPVNPCLDLAG